MYGTFQDGWNEQLYIFEQELVMMWIKFSSRKLWYLNRILRVINFRLYCDSLVLRILRLVFLWYFWIPRDTIEDCQRKKTALQFESLACTEQYQLKPQGIHLCVLCGGCVGTITLCLCSKQSTDKNKGKSLRIFAITGFCLSIEIFFCLFNFSNLHTTNIKR